MPSTDLSVFLTLPSLLLEVAGLSFCYLLGLSIYRVYFHPLTSYPGPKLCAITRLPYLWHLVRGEQTHNTRKLHEVYGSVVRIAPDELSYITGSAWKEIYGHRQGKPEMGKNRRFYSVQPGGEHIIIANREDHSRFRKGLSHGFSDSSMRQQEPLIQSYVDLLMQRLEQHSQNGQTAQNLCSWYNWITFDIIGDLTFGEPFGCLQNAHYHPWVSTIFDSIKAGNWIKALNYIPYARNLASWFIPRNMLLKRELHAEMTIEKVKHRVSLTEDRPGFLGVVLKRKENRFEFDELVGNSGILIVAGSETTATVLAGVTYLLLKHPKIMSEVVAEIRSLFNSNEEISINSTTNLKYMIACLEEALRFYPPTPSGFPRVVPTGGALIDGKWVAEGMSVAISILAAQRSPENFFEPDSYCPERFLDDPRFVNDNFDALNPFSTGPRNCLGKNLAWAELRLILAKTLFNFDLELVPGNEDWFDQKSYTIWERRELNVILKKVIR